MQETSLLLIDLAMLLIDVDNKIPPPLAPYCKNDLVVGRGLDLESTPRCPARRRISGTLGRSKISLPHHHPLTVQTNNDRKNSYILTFSFKYNLHLTPINHHGPSPPKSPRNRRRNPHPTRRAITRPDHREGHQSHRKKHLPGRIPVERIRAGRIACPISVHDLDEAGVVCCR